MNQQTIDLSKYGKNTQKHIGYYDSTLDNNRKIWIPPTISINSNVIILTSIIFSIIIFISQFCLNNLGIPNSTNICQKTFTNIYIKFYYIIIPFFTIIFLYYSSIYDIIIDYFKQQYFNYKNNYPNIFSSIYNYNYSLGFFTSLTCYFKFDKIINLLNKKKEYEII